MDWRISPGLAYVGQGLVSVQESVLDCLRICGELEDLSKIGNDWQILQLVQDWQGIDGLVEDWQISVVLTDWHWIGRLAEYCHRNGVLVMECRIGPGLAWIGNGLAHDWHCIGNGLPLGRHRIDT